MNYPKHNQKKDQQQKSEIIFEYIHLLAVVKTDTYIYVCMYVSMHLAPLKVKSERALSLFINSDRQVDGPIKQPHTFLSKDRHTDQATTHLSDEGQTHTD